MVRSGMSWSARTPSNAVLLRSADPDALAEFSRLGFLAKRGTLRHSVTGDTPEASQLLEALYRATRPHGRDGPRSDAERLRDLIAGPASPVRIPQAEGLARHAFLPFQSGVTPISWTDEIARVGNGCSPGMAGARRPQSMSRTAACVRAPCRRSPSGRAGALVPCMTGRPPWHPSVAGLRADWPTTRMPVHPEMRQHAGQSSCRRPEPEVCSGPVAI